MKSNFIEREAVATGHTLEEFRNAVKAVEKKYISYHNGDERYTEENDELDYNLKLPPWVCQIYIRPPPEEHIQKMEIHRINEDLGTHKRYYDDEGNQISRKLMKKLRRIHRRPKKLEGAHERNPDSCKNCGNPIGFKCTYKLCKTCCKDKCFYEVLDCKGHKFLFKTKIERRQKDVPSNNKLEMDLI